MLPTSQSLRASQMEYSNNGRRRIPDPPPHNPSKGEYRIPKIIPSVSDLHPTLRTSSTEYMRSPTRAHRVNTPF
ncbi:hypothetical protein M501DRAFT_1000183, partial [Patellaria atrata CBS 101060]